MNPPNVSELITEKRLHVRHWMWRQRFERVFGPHTGLIGEGSQLHFLFGVAGGGVDHLSRLIVQPGTQIRFFNRVLERVEPRLVLSTRGHRLAMAFFKDLEPTHPLLRVYRMLVEYDNEWATLRSSNRARPSGPETVPCLVTESHALLSTEAVLRALGARALLYVSDPIKIVDRLLSEQGEGSPYLTEEGRSVLAPSFLARFMRRDYAPVMRTYSRLRRLGDTRQRNILHRVLVVALIHHMFRMLSARYPEQAILVDYERIAQDPLHLEPLMERLFGEPGFAIGRMLSTAALFRPDGQRQVVWRSSWPERVFVPGFLRPEDIQASEEMLHDSGLETSAPPTTLESLDAARGG